MSIDINEIAMNAAHGKLNLLLDSHFGNPAYISVQSSWPHMLEFCHELIALVDEARGEQEPVAWRFKDDLEENYIGYLTNKPTDEQFAYLAKWNRPTWEPLVLRHAPIPEGMQLVSIEPTDAMCAVIRNEDCIYRTEKDLYSALLEAAKEHGKRYV